MSVDGGIGFTEGMWIFFIGSPAIHIEFHGGKSFPLEVTGIHAGILSSEDPIHIGSDIGLSGKSGSDIGRDVETDIFPLSTCLVTRPDACIPLGTRPTVQGNNKWPCILSIVWHNVPDIRDTIQAKGISGSDPSHICFQDAHAGIPNFLHYIALQ